MATMWLYIMIFVLCCIPRNEGGKRVVKEKVKHPQASTDDVMKYYSLELEYAIQTDGLFKSRGMVQISSLKQSSSVVTFHQESLSHSELKDLKEAAMNNNFYFLRAKNNFSSDTDEEEDGRHSNMVMTLVSACALLKSQLQDRIIIRGDGYGNVISLTILPDEPALETSLDCTDTQQLTNKLSFTTVVQYVTPEAGPVPQTQAFLQKQEAEKAKRETEDNRSFLQKYWLYIIIGLVAVQFLGGMGSGAAGAG